MAKKIKQMGIGEFARACLAPASKECKGKPNFQACRREFISRCKREKGY